jgi:asparagine synthase (glutamine-hydrolysing)
MCGIVGHVAIRGHEVDRTAVAEGMRRLAHRGPDGEGMATFEQACLGHRRLSIIDLRGSPQPWVSADGRYTLVFNGEIYNFIELRAGLEASGVRFRSQGDTEVLLELFIRYGPACLESLNGMFAFAVWDDVARALFLARDRLGKKPLYYAVCQSGLAFASEIRAVRAFAGIDTGFDQAGVHDYFAYQFIPGEKSVFSGIRKLPPAHCLSFIDGRLDLRRYWTPPRPEPSREDESALREELVALVDDAVRLRLRSDVPLGVFLSGGIDSALITSAMRRQGVVVQAFTIGFADHSYDESRTSAASARFLDVQHHVKTLEPEFEPILQDWLRAFGEPFADPSAVPTWYLCRHARDHVTVALSGDGGDELFAGYRRYRARQFLELYERLPHVVKWLCSTVVDALPEGEQYFARSPVKMFKLFLRMRERLAAAPGDVLPQVFSPEERQRLFAGNISVRCNDFVDSLGLRGLDPVTQMQLADLQTYLAEDILTKVDRMSMAHGLEVRSPLLDYRIVEFASRLPVGLKIRGNVQKWLLQEAFRERLPPATLGRRKQGFAVPLATWLRGRLRTLFEQACLDDLPEFLDGAYVRSLWEQQLKGGVDHGFKLWTLLVFCLWRRQLAEGG